MQIKNEKVGAQIAALRKAKNLTQNELGERLQISFQAVSKWERGETLPDTAILLDLANALETTIDNILSGGERAVNFKGKLAAKDMRDGIDALRRAGYLLGAENLIYRSAIEGISAKVNTNVAEMLADDFLRECLVAEAIIQNIMAGYYFDLTEVRGAFKHDKWYNIVAEYAKKYALV
ncbi:MAG: helix-turn-helix domain-containing protein [Oscillospiraceae bacterium]|jgi:transcriptional regulator with XRE-family HTH domain|nr:helix-turn-helix domain-containing protein [Oscillospiraceae bacterium]